MSKKRSITFDKEFKKNTDKLGWYMFGVNPNTIYGSEPKTLRFGVILALNEIKRVARRTLALNDTEFENYLSSIRNARKKLQKAVSEQKSRAN